jgi:AcrR family transcriptional regulator
LRVRTEAKRAAIVDVAAQVFLQTGFERASMADIAARVGGSKATLYGYFPNKEELFMTVIRQKMGQVGRALHDLALRGHEDPGEVLGEFGRLYLASTQSAEARALKRVISGYLERDEKTAQAFWTGGVQKMFDMVERYLCDATQAGRLAVSESKVASKQLLSLLEAEFNWTAPARSASITAKAIHAASERAVAVFVAAYAAPKKRAGRTNGSPRG